MLAKDEKFSNDSSINENPKRFQIAALVFTRSSLNIIASNNVPSSTSPGLLCGFIILNYFTLQLFTNDKK